MKKNIYNAVVPFNCHGQRIDKFLQLQLKKISRTKIQNLISDGQVELNNITIINWNWHVHTTSSHKSFIKSLC